MKKIISHLYAEYGKYINRFRAIPMDIDCLKPVERRLLLSIHDIGRKKLIKSATIVGHCIGNYHPHGDISVYGTLVKLVERKLVIGQGNWGISGLHDSKAASMRYTECMANNKLHEIFAPYLEYVEMVNYEIEDEYVHIPFPVPLGLIGFNFIHGIGFNSTLIPRYKFKDLITRLIAILENSKLPPIYPHIRNCKLDGEFDDILMKGSGKIKITPEIKIINNGLIIQGINPLKKFSALIELNKKYNDDYFTVIDTWNYNTKTVVEIQIQPTKHVKFDDEFINNITTTIASSHNVIVNVIEKEDLVQCSIDNLLIKSYTHWKEYNLKYLHDKLIKFNIQIEELKAIIALRKLIKNIDQLDDLDRINNTTYSTKFLLEICNKYKISTLFNVDIDLQSILSKIDEIKDSIDNIDANILENIKQFI